MMNQRFFFHLTFLTGVQFYITSVVDFKSQGWKPCYTNFALASASQRLPYKKLNPVTLSLRIIAWISQEMFKS